MEALESHPESGTTAFTYDANGNLKTGIDDRGKKAESFYDSLDRVIRTEYADLGESAGRVEPTPAVRFFYDGATAFNTGPRTAPDRPTSATTRWDASRARSGPRPARPSRRPTDTMRRAV